MRILALAAPVLLLPLLLMASPAAGMCTHEVFMPEPIQGDGMMLYLYESTPSESGGVWSQEVCFTLANVGATDDSAMGEFSAWDDSDTDLTFAITGVQAKDIGPPGFAETPACSIQGGDTARIESVGDLPAGAFTHLCCFDFEAVAPSTCDELIGQTTTVFFQGAPVYLTDSASVVVKKGGSTVADEDIPLNPVSFDPITGPGCGLLGLEAVALVAIGRGLRAWRARARR